MQNSSAFKAIDREDYDAFIEAQLQKATQTKHVKVAKLTVNNVQSMLSDLAQERDNAHDKMLLDTALFYSDKLISLLAKDPDACKMERYRWAKLLHEKGEYHRAAFALTTKNSYHLKDLSCRYLAAKCYLDAKDYQEAMDILLLPVEPDCCFYNAEGTLNEWQSSLELLKGYAYEALNNQMMANQCFIEALRFDVFCYEALEALIRYDIITPFEEEELSKILQTGDQSKATEYIKHFYKKELRKYPKSDQKEEEKEDEEVLDKVEEVEDEMSKNARRLAQCNLNSEYENASIDAQLLKAEKLYEECDYHQCYELVDRIYKQNLFNPQCVLLLLNCLMELNKLVQLQLLSHKLVEIYPESSVSWYAVGCYYYQQSNADQARKYFSKATTIDNNFHPAMLMFGHSFELESLHDLSLAVYLDLSKTMPRSFLPLLYIGVEYSHINNPLLAESFLQQALHQSNDDLFVVHELAIVHFQKGDYQLAKEAFLSIYNRLALKNVMLRFPPKWEPLLNNLGHVCRKLGNYEEAIEYHNQARTMSPSNASTYDAIGLCYSHLRQFRTACDWFQRALSSKRDDAFAKTMYEIVYNYLIEENQDGEEGNEEEISNLSMDI